jgi:hypothetical protein
MPNPKRENFITTNVRLPREVHREVKRRAKRERKTMNDIYVAMLSGHDTAREAALLTRLHFIFEPILYRAIDVAASTAAEIVLAAFKDGEPSKIEELEQRLSDFRDALKRMTNRMLSDAVPKPDETTAKPDEGEK